MRTATYLPRDEDREKSSVFGHSLNMSTNINLSGGTKAKSLWIPFKFYAMQPVVSEQTRGGTITDVKVSEKATIDQAVLLEALRSDATTVAKYHKLLEKVVSNIYVTIEFSDLRVEGAALDLKALTKSLHSTWQEGVASFEENKGSEATMFRNILLIYLNAKSVANGKVTMFPSNKN